MSEGNTTQSANKQDYENLLAIGLISAGFVIIQAFIPLGMIDVPVSISILAFALSIPLLGTYTLAVATLRKYSGSKIPFWLGVIGAGVGITAAFWHASWIAGVTFIAGVIIATPVTIYFSLKD
jgi:hypothetical protein